MCVWIQTFCHYAEKEETVTSQSGESYSRDVTEEKHKAEVI